MSEDKPLTFELLFTIPQLDSAFMRNPAGGARMKIDIDPATVADANRMLDLMSKSAGVVFAAAVVVVLEPERQEVQSKTTMGKWHRGGTNE